MKITRIVNSLRRVLNYASCMKNRLKLSIYGINYGKHCTIHGKLSINMEHSSHICIGDNFYCSSGNNINPLCATDRGCFCVNDGASIVIGNNVAMSSTRIRAHKSVTIGDNVLIGGGCTILDSNSHSLNWKDRRDIKTDIAHKHDAGIKIEDDVLIGMNSMILKGVTIGARSVIGAGSVVTKSIPPDSIAAGNPAKAIKTIERK